MRPSQLQSIIGLALLAAVPVVRVFVQAATAAEPPVAVPVAPPAAPEPAPAAVVVEAPAAATEAPRVAAVVVPQSVADKPAAEAPHPEEAVKGKDAAGRDTLSVDFPDEDIRNILRNVADLFELNIIMPETLQGKTTIKLRDVTWRQIFQNVLDPVGYAYVEEGNIIKIVSKETLNEEPVTTEVFLINYARAADILPTVTSLVDTTKGKIVVDARSNSLVITERPTRMSRIRPIIEQLDRATDQVMIESKFVEVTDRDIKNVGVNWASLAAYNVSVGNIQGTFDRSRGQTTSNGVDRSNSTGNSGTSGTENSNTTTGTNTQNNGSTNQNTITSTNGIVTSVAQAGTTGALNNQTQTTTVNGTTASTEGTFDNALSLLQNITGSGDTNRTLSAVFNADEFRLVLSALQTQNEVKIVSNPTIVTLNNSEAVINVGSEDPIPNYTYNQERGSFEVSGFTYKPIGIILKVTPQVNNRGFIKLTLSPEVSQKNGSTTFGGAGGATIPIIATRKATTTVSLKDGFTMGIGGLLTTSNTNGSSKVPVLGSMPVLGRLFRSDNKSIETTNLIIFITAKTINAEGAPVEQVFESERVRQLKMRREDLPGHRDGSSPWVEAAPVTAATTSSRLATPERK